MNEQNIENVNQKKSKKRWLWLLLLLLLIPLLLRACISQSNESPPDGSCLNNYIILPENGQMPDTLSDEEVKAIREGLDKKVKEGEVALKMNPSPILKNGKLNIECENPKSNNSLITFQILIGEKEIYNTNAFLAPNSHVETCDISQKLDKGSHEAKVVIKTYDIETKEQKGTAQTKINITVI